ncbi:hypothetical protein JXL19_02520 [bacterium]|nr:hypothetical protein [bacterium]
MKKTAIFIILAIILIPLFSKIAWGDDLLELEKRVGSIEEKLKKEEKEGILSFKGKRFKLGGEMEFEYVDTRSDQKIDNPEGHFQVERFSLIPQIQVAENIILEALLLFSPEKTDVNETYAVISGLPLDSFLKLGMDDRFISEKPNRRTEAYPLIGTAFWRDDEAGITWSGKHKEFYWNLSLTNGFALGKKEPSEDKSYQMIQDKRQTSDNNENKDIGLGLGWKRSFASNHLIDVHGFGYFAKLSRDDIDFLKKIAGYGSSEVRMSRRYGASTEYVVNAFSLGGEYIKAEDGTLDRDGWFAQASYRISFGKRTFFPSIEPFVRYGRLNIDLPKVFSDTLTWNREMTTIALLVDIVKNMKVKIEYYINDEKTGGNDVKNDEFLAQLEIMF